MRATSTINLPAQRDRRLREKLSRELGPEILSALADPSVVELVLNADGELWCERLGEPLAPMGVRMGRVRAETLLGTVAALVDREINDERPILETELPYDGSRFEGVVPPVSSAPVFAIRRRAVRVFTLDEFASTGVIAPAYARALRGAIAARENIVICGGTGSGKTTLANALLAEAVRSSGDAERFVILEDTLELRCDAPNHLQLRTSETVDLDRLVRATMRLRPDRVVVGEVRGREALALLKVWLTGHPGGVSTVHATSARAALSRLDQLVQEAGVPSQPALIAEAVDWLVVIQRRPEGRRVTELVRVAGYVPGSGFDLRDVASLGLATDNGGER